MTLAAVLQLLALVVEGVENIATNPTIRTAAEMAEAILKITGAVTGPVQRATPEIARERIAQLLEQLRANDAAADSALAARFPSER